MFYINSPFSIQIAPCNALDLHSFDISFSSALNIDCDSAFISYFGTYTKLTKGYILIIQLSAFYTNFLLSYIIYSLSHCVYGESPRIQN